MRIISQDGTIDVPYNFFSVSIASGKYKDVEYGCIYCHNISALHGTKLAEYSSKEKALKAMEMLRDHHEKVAFLKTVINTEKGTQFVSGLSKTDFNKLTQNYFQFPQDDEIEV
jgi:hypothetical protein|nr:MAG TPA: hypothetical protein [Caudoviricetes sp.]